jgi:hypothetical protein
MPSLESYMKSCGLRLHDQVIQEGCPKKKKKKKKKKKPQTNRSNSHSFAAEKE